MYKKCLKELMDSQNPELAHYVEKKLLKRLQELANFEHNESDNDRKGTMVLSVYNPASNPEYSRRFFILNLECISKWATDFRTDPAGTGEESKFEKAYEKLLRHGVNFPRSARYINTLQAPDITENIEDKPKQPKPAKIATQSEVISEPLTPTSLSRVTAEVKSSLKTIAKARERIFRMIQMTVASSLPKVVPSLMEEVKTAWTNAKSGLAHLDPVRDRSLKKYEGELARERGFFMSLLSKWMAVEDGADPAEWKAEIKKEWVECGWHDGALDEIKEESAHIGDSEDKSEQVIGRTKLKKRSGLVETSNDNGNQAPKPAINFDSVFEKSPQLFNAPRSSTELIKRKDDSRLSEVDGFVQNSSRVQQDLSNFDASVHSSVNRNLNRRSSRNTQSVKEEQVRNGSGYLPAGEISGVKQDKQLSEGFNWDDFGEASKSQAQMDHSESKPSHNKPVIIEDNHGRMSDASSNHAYQSPRQSVNHLKPDHDTLNKNPRRRNSNNANVTVARKKDINEPPQPIVIGKSFKPSFGDFFADEKAEVLRQSMNTSKISQEKQIQIGGLPERSDAPQSNRKQDPRQKVQVRSSSKSEHQPSNSDHHIEPVEPGQTQGRNKQERLAVSPAPNKPFASLFADEPVIGSKRDIRASARSISRYDSTSRERSGMRSVPVGKERRGGTIRVRRHGESAMALTQTQQVATSLKNNAEIKREGLYRETHLGDSTLKNSKVLEGLISPNKDDFVEPKELESSRRSENRVDNHYAERPRIIETQEVLTDYFDDPFKFDIPAQIKDKSGWESPKQNNPIVESIPIPVLKSTRSIRSGNEIIDRSKISQQKSVHEVFDFDDFEEASAEELADEVPEPEIGDANESGRKNIELDPFEMARDSAVFSAQAGVGDHRFGTVPSEVQSPKNFNPFEFGQTGGEDEHHNNEKSSETLPLDNSLPDDRIIYRPNHVEKVAEQQKVFDYFKEETNSPLGAGLQNKLHQNNPSLNQYLQPRLQVNSMGTQTQPLALPEPVIIKEQLAKPYLSRFMVDSVTILGKVHQKEEANEPSKIEKLTQTKPILTRTIGTSTSTMSDSILSSLKTETQQNKLETEFALRKLSETELRLKRCEANLLESQEEVRELADNCAEKESLLIEAGKRLNLLVEKHTEVLKRLEVQESREGSLRAELSSYHSRLMKLSERSQNMQLSVSPMKSEAEYEESH